MILNSIANFLPKSTPKQPHLENINQTNPMTNNFSRAALMFSGFYNFDELQQQMSKDIENYVFANKRFDEAEIEAIIKKYSPTTTFKQTKTSAFEFIPSREVNAQTIQRFEVIPKPNSTGYKVHKYPQSVSAIFPTWYSKKQKTLFAARLIHEFTHVLQEDLLPSQGVIPLAEKFVSSNKNLTKIDLTLEAASCIFNYIELDMIHKFKKILKTSSNEPKKIPDKISLDWEFLKETGRSLEQDLNQTYKQMYKQLGNTVNWNFVHDYVSLRAKVEAIAYQKELSFLRKHLAIQNERCDFDLKIELYEKISSYSTKLKLKNVKQKKPLK